MVTTRSRVADEAGQDVEQRRLAGAGAARHDDVQPRGNGAPEKVQHRLRQRVALDEVLSTETVGAEAANAHRRTVEGQRRDDRVHARAVLQARIDHRARLVDAPSHRADDALDDLHQVAVVLEDHRCFLEPAVPLDVDLIEPVHEDVRDVAILEQHLERAEAEELIEHVADQVLALEQAERRRVRLRLDHRVDQAADLGLGVAAADLVQSLQVEPVEQLLVDLGLELLIMRTAGVPRRPRDRDVAAHGCYRFTVVP